MVKIMESVQYRRVHSTCRSEALIAKSKAAMAKPRAPTVIYGRVTGRLATTTWYY